MNWTRFTLTPLQLISVVKSRSCRKAKLRALVQRTFKERQVAIVHGAKSAVHAVLLRTQPAGREPRLLGARTGMCCLLWVRTDAWHASADTGQGETQCSSVGAWYSTRDVNRNSATKACLNGTSQELSLEQRQG
ncbi:hypothetical protein MRX96_050254 [Rhipicephalus microplus]